MSSIRVIQQLHLIAKRTRFLEVRSSRQEYLEDRFFVFDPRHMPGRPLNGTVHSTSGNIQHGSSAEHGGLSSGGIDRKQLPIFPWTGAEQQPFAIR